jgi:protein KTI12
MPLIIMSGLPSSGKTTRALELQEALEKKIASSLRKFKVHVINDDTLGIDREVYRGTSSVHLHSRARFSCFVSLGRS